MQEKPKLQPKPILQLEKKIEEKLKSFVPFRRGPLKRDYALHKGALPAQDRKFAADTDRERMRLMLSKLAEEIKGKKLVSEEKFSKDGREFTKKIYSFSPSSDWLFEYERSRLKDGEAVKEQAGPPELPVDYFLEEIYDEQGELIDMALKVEELKKHPRRDKTY